MKQQRKTTFMEGGNPTLKQAPILSDFGSFFSRIVDFFQK